LASFVDTHCHLDFNIFDSDRPEVINRAIEAGVSRIINPGIDLQTSQVAIHLAEVYPAVKAAIGVHPNDGSTWHRETISHLRELASRPGVVAIGEIGLDYYRDRTPKVRQKEIFRSQLDLAAELILPVIIHNRQSIHDLMPILGEWHDGLVKAGSILAKRPGVLHSFDGTLADAQQAIAMNFFIGVSGPVTFTNARQRQTVIAALPLSHLLLETDAPFLTPHPHRGERNEPAYVRLMGMKVAELLDQPMSVIFEATSSNASRLFPWGE
jgi:TatD DNase family protein